MAKKSRKELLADDANQVGLFVRTYSPGDGLTRYRMRKNSIILNILKGE